MLIASSSQPESNSEWIPSLRTADTPTHLPPLTHLLSIQRKPSFKNTEDKPNKQKTTLRFIKSLRLNAPTWLQLTRQLLAEHPMKIGSYQFNESYRKIEKKDEKVMLFQL